MCNQNDIDKIDEFFLTTGQGEIYNKVIGGIEKMLIERALERSRGNQIEASKTLGINRNTLHAKIKKLDINVRKYK